MLKIESGLRSCFENFVVDAGITVTGLVAVAAGNSPRKIILADDHAILRDGIKVLLNAEPSFEVVGEVSDGLELMAMLKTTPCDLVILDISMPNLNGLLALEKLQVLYPGLKVLIFSMHRDVDHVKEAMTKGASGYLLKDAAFEKLVFSLHEIFRGNKAFGPEATTAIMADYSNIRKGQATLDTLTRREREVLRELVKGKTNREIADELDISFRTVEGHRANLMLKLEAKNMAELMRTALALGIE